MDWLKKTFSESGGVSASRQLFAILLVTCCVCLYMDTRLRPIGAAWATVATGLATALAGVWWKGKSNGPEQPK